jgi:hypothetical protein
MPREHERCDGGQWQRQQSNEDETGIERHQHDDATDCDKKAHPELVNDIGDKWLDVLDIADDPLGEFTALAIRKNPGESSCRWL